MEAQAPTACVAKVLVKHVEEDETESCCELANTADRRHNSAKLGMPVDLPAALPSLD